jgi:hypothetical protein
LFSNPLNRTVLSLTSSYIPLNEEALVASGASKSL